MLSRNEQATHNHWLIFIIPNPCYDDTMTPIVTSRKTPSKEAALVFFVRDGEAIERNPMFPSLEKDERTYALAAAKHAAPKENEAKTLIAPQSGRKLLLVGVGKTRNGETQKIARALRVAVHIAKKEKAPVVAFAAEPVENKAKTARHYESLAASALMANFEFVKYKTPPEGGFSFVKEIEVIHGPNKTIEAGLRRGATIGEEVNECRELSNTPGGDMTPRVLASHAAHISEGTLIKTTILDEKEMKKMGMGGVLGVSRGSSEPPRFIVMEYAGGKKSEKPIVLVGKGVTFDTGGLNLKPSNSIYEMHMDMSGGAAVIHALRAAARLKIKKNIVALVPAVENMPSGSSYRPGDVLRAMSGKTIEVLNTDAEGRIILADALSYAKKYNPSVVIDVATLTGAAVVALGQRYSALFATDKKLEATLRRIGGETGDAVWPLPLSADYEEDIKGTFGDVANSEKTRYGGAITAAVFLWQFVKDSSAGSISKNSYPWAHLDIAPRMTSIEGEYLAKGAAGAPVRLLVRFIEEA